MERKFPSSLTTAGHEYRNYTTIKPVTVVVKFVIGFGIVLGLLASVFKSSKSITTKIASTDSNEYVTSFATRFFSIPVFILGVVLTQSFVVPNSATFLYALAVNSIAMVSTTILIAKALKLSDISVISPLLAFVPISVIIPSYLILDEVPTLVAGSGIVLVSIGAYVLNTGGENTGFLEPIRRLGSDRGARYILLVLVIVSVTPSVDKIGIQETSPLMWVLCTHVFASLGILLFTLSVDSEVAGPLQDNLKMLVLVGLSSSLIWVFQSYGYTITQVSYIQALKRVSLLFSVIAGKFIFQEENIKRRLVGAVIMLVGVMAIVLGA